MSNLHVAVVGLGFGASFVPIYKKHPAVGKVTACDPNPELLQRVAAENGIESRKSTLDEVLADETVDAVHLLTPVPFHVEQTLKVLNSGLHCACAVPAATDLDDLRKIVDAEKRSRKNYMMMETGVYTREFLYAQQMIETGELGNITFLRGTYYQDLSGDRPDYWRAQPPMHYGTHALGPVLALAKKRAVKVCCMGSGTLHPHIQMPGGNRFPLQTGIFRLEDSDVAVEVTRSWFQTARTYTEAFSVYGDKSGFEWQQIESEDPMVYRLETPPPGQVWNDAPGERVKVPFRPDLFPEELEEFTEGWHGGSHPHLVHEFISSIAESRPAAINAIQSANWTAPGICANLSSLQDGDPVTIPAFD